MNITLTASLVCACFIAAVLVGMRIRRRLPDHHLSADTKDTVKLAMGLVATMSALLLGLLVTSAKSSYDTTRGQVVISTPLLVVLVSWLVLIFISFSLLAPSNATATIAMIISAFSVAGAIFLILQLDRPFSGIIKIPSAPMVNALSHLAK